MNIYAFLISTYLLLILPGTSVSILIANTLRYNFISGIKTTLGTVTGSASMFVLYAYGFDFLNNQLNLFFNYCSMDWYFLSILYWL